MNKLKVAAIAITILLIIFSVVSSVLMIMDNKVGELSMAGIGVSMLAEIVFAIAVGIIIWTIAVIRERN